MFLFDVVGEEKIKVTLLEARRLLFVTQSYRKRVTWLSKERDVGL